MARVGPVDRQMNDRPLGVTLLRRDPELPHELHISRADPVTVDLRDDARARDLPDIRHARFVDLLPVGRRDTAADRMTRMRFRERCEFEELFIFHGRVVDARHRKIALRDRSGLVKCSHRHLRQRLHIIRTLDQDSVRGRAADAAEERQRDRDHDRARAADDQECQSPVDPVPEIRSHPHDEPDNRRNERQRQRTVADRRRVNAGEFRNELLRLRLAGARVLDEIQDLRRGGFLEFARRPHFDHAGHVDAAGNYLVADPRIPRQALARERGRIQRCGPEGHDAVNRNFLARLDNNDAADLHVVRVDPLGLAVLIFEVRVIRPDVHELGDIFPALSDRVALEKLPDLVEPHDGDALRVLAERHRADGRDRHQEMLVKHLLIPDPLEGLLKDIVPDREVGNEEQQEPNHRILLKGQQREHDHAHAGDNHPQQKIFLFFRHFLPLFEK